MEEPLSKSHRILEKGPMQFRPFGVEETGEVIRDTTGVKVRAFIDYLEESVTRSRGPDAGEQAVQTLCRLLNERIPDHAYHVSPEFLKNEWNSYSYEFVCFLVEFCKDISEDTLFAFHAGRDKFISSLLQILGRPFSVRQIYSQFPHFGEKLSSLILSVESVSNRSAVLTMAYPDAIFRKFAPYGNACAELICQSAKGGLAAIPEKVHHLPPATVRDVLCIADGDECCKWELTWEPETGSHLMWKLIGLASSGLVLAYIYIRHPELSPLETALFAVPPAILGWLADSLRTLHKRMRAREALVQEQLDSADARHEELRRVYLEQEQQTVELRHAYEEIESLNVGLEEKVRQRTAELEAANQELTQMDRLKSQFLAHVSHELRTPLTVIKGLTENLVDRLAGPLTTKQEHNLKRVIDNTARLARMITDLLERSRSEAGKIDLALKELNVAALACEVVEQLAPLAQAKGQQLECRVPEPIGAVWADPDKVIRIMTNLVDNAIKYTPEGGAITVTLESDTPQWARISVRDTGPGISPEALPKLFDQFYRVAHRHPNAPKGLGLGLSIVKQLVELHGGAVTVESQVDHGSVFQFTLPLRPNAEELPACAGATKRKILVVDDDPDIRHFLHERLSAYGYEIDTVADGPQALHRLTAGPFDGMILDITLPGLDGLAVLREIRERSAIPIIMVTASGAKDRAVQAVSVGAQDYLLKPFDAGQLREVVERWFGTNIPAS
jgi:signal transduction histidine kinase